MKQARRHAYLQAMGITPWLNRLASPASKADQAVPLRVVVQYEQPGFSVGVGEAGIMLGKLLNALRLKASDYKLVQLSDPAQYVAEQYAAQTLAFVDGVQSGPGVFALPTLQAMLQDRQQKKIAWDLLKPWVGKLS